MLTLIISLKFIFKRVELLGRVVLHNDVMPYKSNLFELLDLFKLYWVQYSFVLFTEVCLNNGELV